MYVGTRSTWAGINMVATVTRNTRSRPFHFSLARAYPAMAAVNRVPTTFMTEMKVVFRK